MSDEKKNWFGRMFGGKKKQEGGKPADTKPVAADTLSRLPFKPVITLAPRFKPEDFKRPVEAPFPVEASSPAAVVKPDATAQSNAVSPSSSAAERTGAKIAEPKPAPEIKPEIKPEINPEINPAPETKSEANPAPEIKPELAPETEKKSWLQRLKDGLMKSANAISEGIAGIFSKSKLDDDMLEELEDLLITTDLGVTVASRLTSKLGASRYDKEISADEVKEFLASEIEAILKPVAEPLKLKPDAKPHVILMTGVNGAGKTTTIGKLARKYKAEGKKVMLAAADTFRAAAIEQLQVWGERSGVPVVAKTQGSDAAAVAYEALEKAIAENVDILIVDTAGRLQNREELMAELSKVVRVISRKIEGAPHDTLIVLDATTGQNALMQVDAFKNSAAISGLVMTKLDGSARGGVLVAVADKYGLPIHAIGVGESIEDLQPFTPKDFARNLVGLNA